MRGARKRGAPGCNSTSVRILHLLSGSLIFRKTWGSDKDASGQIVPLESTLELVGPKLERR